MAKTIFITGASRGMGKLWVEALLQRGDQVAATARDPQALNDLVAKYGNNLLPLQLDVNDRAAGFAAVKKATEHFGHIDVLINNAGYGLFGSIEEINEKEARSQMETNFFGLMWLTQAIVPIMRQQGYGHIIQVSSVLGLRAFPNTGMYNASKFAVEGLSSTLALEVKGFGINVTMVEPNSYATEWGTAAAVHATSMPEYDGVRAALYSTMTDDVFGVPEATVPAMLQLIDTQNPPLRIFFGKYGNYLVKQEYESRLAEWETWNEVSVKAHGK